MELMRFITCGSVDDGKSTLIGRMLYDSQAVQADLLEAIQEASQRNGHERLDLALLTDGLKAEREQGITIDVAYKYFNTAKRKYIIADTPGHIQYTRNMVTGASTAHLAILLVDARHGIVEQTRRHAYIAALLRLRHIVLAVNKMDLVDYSQDRYEEIRQNFLDFIQSFDLPAEDARVVPISALEGDNVVHDSTKMPWYHGQSSAQSLLDQLDSIELSNDENLDDFRFPVQSVIRPQSAQFQDYRAYSGQLRGGVVQVGDAVEIWPGRQRTHITQIELAGKKLKQAFPPMSISLLLEDDLDISRGDLLADPKMPPLFSQECTVEIFWMNETPLQPKSKYILQHTTCQLQMVLLEIIYRVNIHSFEKETKAEELVLNDIGRIRFKLQRSLYFDLYSKNKHTGSFILIDPNSFQTVGAGLFV